MEILGIFFGLFFFTGITAFWLYISKKYKWPRWILVPGLMIILLPAALGAVSMGWWMFVQEPLYSAACSGDKAGVEAALRRGANPNTPSDEGDTALKMAAENGHEEIVRILIAHGAKQ